MATDTLLTRLGECARSATARDMRAQQIAQHLRAARAYRWVGLYEVDFRVGMVRNIAWSGPAPPCYPEFSISNGLTGRAIRTRATINVGTISGDPDYLTALQTTASEVIVPILHHGTVVGTIDVESNTANAFTYKEQELLERVAKTIAALWNR